MPIIQDKEFGKITIRRSAKASQIRIKLAPDGTLRASMPLYAPVFLVKRMLKASRDEIRQLITKTTPVANYEDGMRIGKSHTIITTPTENESSVTRNGQHIYVKLAYGSTLDDNDIKSQIKKVVIEALRVEAKSYLPRRLQFIASKYGYNYQKIRFSHASGRWGSCSSNGTISLNIALMKLPFELIDYVLIHELSHTVHMDHSQLFWNEVSKADPLYINHRSLLKLENPSI